MPSRPPASLVEGFQPKHRALWGHQPIRLRHRLEETGLFTDDALAALIDGYPRENYDLLSMAAQGTGNLAHWEEGELGPLEHEDSHMLTNLLEGTYTCVIVVDP